MRRLLLLLLAFSATFACAADYAREKKWADEITPGIVVGDPVYLETKTGRKFLSIYAEASKAKGAVIAVHGMGVHPDWGLIGVLRSQLPDFGYTSLSVQMPVLAADAKPEDYADTFPEASERLASAVTFLQGKRYKKIAIVSHSLGARMANDYFKRNPNTPVSTWVSIGISTGLFESPEKIKIPVLDLYGENDFSQVLSNAAKRAEAIKNIKESKQVIAPGTDHYFTGKDAELVKYVREFLDEIR